AHQLVAALRHQKGTVVGLNPVAKAAAAQAIGVEAQLLQGQQAVEIALPHRADVDLRRRRLCFGAAHGASPARPSRAWVITWRARNSTASRHAASAGQKCARIRAARALRGPSAGCPAAQPRVSASSTSKRLAVPNVPNSRVIKQLSPPMMACQA